MLEINTEQKKITLNGMDISGQVINYKIIHNGKTTLAQLTLLTPLKVDITDLKERKISTEPQAKR